jgi:hypothetical protein
MRGYGLQRNSAMGAEIERRALVIERNSAMGAEIEERNEGKSNSRGQEKKKVLPVTSTPHRKLNLMC